MPFWIEEKILSFQRKKKLRILFLREEFSPRFYNMRPELSKKQCHCFKIVMRKMIRMCVLINIATILREVDRFTFCSLCFNMSTISC